MNRLEPLDVIRIALTSVPGAHVPANAADFVLMGLKLAGYQITESAAAAPIGAAPAAPARSVPTIVTNTPRAVETEERRDRRDPIRFPYNCAVCHKIINDRAHGEECSNNRCPL